MGREMGCMREMADVLWEGHTLLKTGLSVHGHRQTDGHTKVKTVGLRQFCLVHLADVKIITGFLYVLHGHLRAAQRTHSVTIVLTFMHRM